MFVLAALLAALAAWTKAEGLLLALCLGCVVAAASTLVPRQSSVGRVPPWVFTAIVWVPLLVLSPWMLLQARYGMPQVDFPSFSPGVALARLHLLPKILAMMARELLRPGR